MKLKTIAVMGSGKLPWSELSVPLGKWIAESGHNLLTGGGQGVMSEVSRAFTGVEGRAGRSIGIVPTRPDPLAGFVPLDGYPNPYIDIAIVTPLPRREPGQDEGAINRNHVNVLSGDAIVALPGGPGTAQEIEIALRWRKPLILFGPRDVHEYGIDDAPLATTLAEVQSFLREVLARMDAKPDQPESGR
ncbi:LOG family protein [Caballeronia cordobensis]|uniref:SLOG cluster 4 domain-containing protein n=1 Tax=Caballeronia cordobensis TaxID=1353886 RepID=UPI00045EF29B|nr:rossmann fold nucleotide-binding protein-like protein [Burkholderia sp. RPE67]